MRPELSYEQVSISQYQDEISGITAEIAQDNDIVFTLLKQVGRGSNFEPWEVKSCYNDVVVIINVLSDYARMLKETIGAQELGTTEPLKGARWEYHANLCEKIAAKLSKQLGYSYEEACETCAKKRGKKQNHRDVGQDGLSAWATKPREDNDKKEQQAEGTTVEQEAFT